ncbi:MAG: DUF131 domain-containing protein [Candidatus Thorarchaeota archaeon]
MQAGDFIDLIACALIITGVFIIISGIASVLMRSDFASGEQQGESRGIILLGPIPIVWGYGRRTWVIAAIVAVSLFLLALFWF